MRSGNRNYLLQQKRDSKSFDSAPLYRPESDIAASIVDNCNGLSSSGSALDERKKYKLPTPPVQAASIIPRSPEFKTSPRHINNINNNSSNSNNNNNNHNNKNIIINHSSSSKSESSSNQCTDEETNHRVDGGVSGANSSQQTTIEPIAEHKTTLGEAEIQNAVEAAAVIFKKVVLQRRAAKTATANDDGKFVFILYFHHSFYILCIHVRRNYSPSSIFIDDYKMYRKY